MVMLAAGGFPACPLPTEPRPNPETRATQVRLQTHRPTGNPHLLLEDRPAFDLLQVHATAFPPSTRIPSLAAFPSSRAYQVMGYGA